MFIILLGPVLGLMHLYIWVRLVKGPTTQGRARWILTGVLVALALLVLATLLLPRVTGVAEPAWLAWPGYLWLALVVYLCLTALVLEPIRLALWGWTRLKRPQTVSTAATEVAMAEHSAVSRRLFLARAGAVAAGVASVSVVAAGTAIAVGPPELVRVPVRLRRLDPAFNAFRIAVVSDIHLGPLAGRAHTERIVRMINETAPDLVAIVGDLVDGTVAELGSAAEPLRDLHSREGSFFVTGNHEYFVEDTSDWLRELERLGVHPLRNESTLIRRGAAVFGLAGVNDLAGRSKGDGPNFDRALSGLNSAQPTVLLAHQPVQVTTAAAHGVDLQVSGHTHGGQMWPFHYIVRAVQPSLAGLSTVDNTQLYVTRGAGFWGPPVRVGAPPDITVLSLEANG